MNRFLHVRSRRQRQMCIRDSIYTIAAKGCFVAPLNTDLLRETNLKKIEDYMEKIVHLAASCNLSEQELTEMLHFMMEE